MDSTNYDRRTLSESSAGSSSSGNNSYADIESLLPPKYDHVPACGQVQRPTSRGSVLAVVALGISVFCLLVIIGGCCCLVFFRLDLLRPASSTTKGEEEVCLPCIQVSPDPLAETDSPLMTDLEIRRDDVSDTDICCARTLAQYAALFKLILKRQQEVKKLADFLGTTNNDDTEGSTYNRSSVSAHLLYTPTLMPTERSSELLTQNWKPPNESPFSHIRGGLKFYDNKIYVLTPGLYFVYCQILYNRADTDSVADPQIASSYVKRSSIAYPTTSGILLKSRHTRFNRQNDRHSSYVGGLFFMHAGDQLFVQVSDPSIISNDETASFFGLFKVGE